MSHMNDFDIMTISFVDYLCIEENNMKCWYRFDINHHELEIIDHGFYCFLFLFERKTKEENRRNRIMNMVKMQKSIRGKKRSVHQYIVYNQEITLIIEKEKYFKDGENALENYFKTTKRNTQICKDRKY